MCGLSNYRLVGQSRSFAKGRCYSYGSYLPGSEVPHQVSRGRLGDGQLVGTEYAALRGYRHGGVAGRSGVEAPFLGDGFQDLCLSRGGYVLPTHSG